MKDHVNGYAAQLRKPANEELDQVTLRRAQRGEPAAGRTFVKTYERRVFSVISRMLGPRRKHAAEDLAQETFMRAFAALPRFDHTKAAKLSTWLLTIAVRITLDELARANQGRTASDVEAEDQTATVVEQRHSRDVAVRIRAAVEALPVHQRAVVVLREFEEMSYEEVAVALSLDVGTVRSRLSRARETLRLSLREVYHDR
ncbi:MAG: sigma-70 family RNA polymerase sigma factor [Myxococcales bacterium]|nr:sigma-70 family RNA polymerase sigma factor [Myxococcales bacterium]